MNDNSLVIFTRAALMLAEADTIQKAKELKSLALTAAEWAKRKNMGEEAIQHCRSYAFEAERKMGEMLAATAEDKSRTVRGGDRKSKSPEVTLKPTLSDLGVTKRESAEAQKLAALPQEVFEAVKTGTKTRASARRETKRAEVVEKLSAIETKKGKVLSGLYDVVVVDPPWPMEKIERECRPNQVKPLDYPTMTLAEIGEMAIPAQGDCHLWLWTTHRFLPAAFDILKQWGFSYVCAFVWHKAGGFQPMGLPQFNCEFALYARQGSPVFVGTKDFKLCFEAGRGAHSEKPGEFYDLVRRVTSGRRADIFNRRRIEGFDGSGLEAV